MSTDLLSPDTFEFLARFFLAGWVFLSARSWWVRGERPKPNEVIFEAVVLSLLNQLVALLSIPWLRSTGLENQTALLVIEVFGQPLLFGLVTGWLAERDWLPDGLRRLLMPAVRPVANAFQFAIDQLKGPSYIILRYDDDRMVHGFFGAASLADQSVESGGIALERIYVLSEAGEWVQVGGTAWVSLTGVQSVEFISEDEL